MPVRNIQRVKLNLKQAINDIEGKKTQGAIRAVLTQGQTMANSMVPMDTGTLLNSSFVMFLAPNHGRVGYAAEYAKWVHDAPGKLKGQPRAHFGRTANHSSAGPQRPVAFGGGTGKGNYWDPNAEPQFLVKGFEQIMGSVPAILRAAYAS